MIYTTVDYMITCTYLNILSRLFRALVLLFGTGKLPVVTFWIIVNKFSVCLQSIEARIPYLFCIEGLFIMEKALNRKQQDSQFSRNGSVHLQYFILNSLNSKELNALLFSIQNHYNVIWIINDNLGGMSFLDILSNCKHTNTPVPILQYDIGEENMLITKNAQS